MIQHLPINHRRELRAMTADQLKGVIRLMNYQVKAPLVVGGNDRAKVVQRAAIALLHRRGVRVEIRERHA